jgi:outer membrane protein TolC
MDGLACLNLRKRAPGAFQVRLRVCTRVVRRLSIGTVVGVGLCALTLSSTFAQTPAAPAEANAAPLQLMQPSVPGQASAPPVTITLQDALQRAQKNSAEFLAVVSDGRSAHEDVVQARAERLPQLTHNWAYLNTMGNGKVSDGRFVTNDGVHIYQVWGILKQDLSANTIFGTSQNRASSAEALANARIEIARRGLGVTVTKNFYDLVIAQRKYATAQQAVEQARRFRDLTLSQERAGQGPHSDTIKAEIQSQQAEQAFDDANLAMGNARLNLAVILFPQLNENFTAVDDLESAPSLPGFPEVQDMAGKQNPDLRVATETLRESSLDVSSARAAFYPVVSVETDFGIQANAFALHSVRAAFPEEGVLPNLGYFLQINMNVPVWDWGSLRSKYHQAQYKQDQAKAVLSQTQRQLLTNLYTAYNEAMVARSAVEKSRRTADLATESLRLVNLRFQAGTSTALEVVDAQNTLIQTRNTYDDAQVRYRVSLANLQTLTGTF